MFDLNIEEIKPFGPGTIWLVDFFDYTQAVVFGNGRNFNVVIPEAGWPAADDREVAE